MLTLTNPPVSTTPVSEFVTRLFAKAPATIEATVTDKDFRTVIVPSTHQDAEAVADVVENLYNVYWIGGEENGVLRYTVPTRELSYWDVEIIWC